MLTFLCGKTCRTAVKTVLGFMLCKSESPCTGRQAFGKLRHAAEAENTWKELSVESKLQLHNNVINTLTLQLTLYNSSKLDKIKSV